MAFALSHDDYNTNTGAVYQTLDNGVSWNIINGNLPTDLRLVEMLIHPNDSDSLYVVSGRDRFSCSEARLYQSPDGGINWSQLALTELGSRQVLDATLDPHNPSTIYLSTMNFNENNCTLVNREGDLLKSEDAGISWFDPSPDNNSFNDEITGVFWMDPNNPDHIKLIDHRITALWNPRSGTFSSTDGGQNWIKTGVVDNWDTHYIGQYMNSTQDTIQRAYGGNGNYHNTLGESLSNPDVLFWVNSRFAYKTEDGGSQFDNLFTNETNGTWTTRGLDNVVLFTLKVSRKNPDFVVAGYFDSGLWYTMDGGQNWESGNDTLYNGSWLGLGGDVRNIVLDPDFENRVWSTHQGAGSNASLLYNTNHADRHSWELRNDNLPVTQLITGLCLDPNSDPNNRSLYAVIDSSEIYKTVDSGLNWIHLQTIPGIWLLEVDPNNSNYLYAAGRSGFHSSSDGGNTWSNTGHANMVDSGNTRDIASRHYRGVSSIHSVKCQVGTLYVTYLEDENNVENKGLYKSEDFGQTWIKLSTASDDYLRTVLVSESDHDRILLGSSFVGSDGGYNSASVGFQSSTNGGTTFSITSTNMPYNNISLLKSNHDTSAEFIWAISQGPGMYNTFAWTVFEECCNQNMDNQSGLRSFEIDTSQYQVAGSINTSSPTKIYSGADVLYDAADTICLNIGFEVQSNGSFEAKIDGCDQN